MRTMNRLNHKTQNIIRYKITRMILRKLLSLKKLKMLYALFDLSGHLANLIWILDMSLIMESTQSLIFQLEKILKSQINFFFFYMPRSWILNLDDMKSPIFF